MKRRRTSSESGQELVEFALLLPLLLLLLLGIIEFGIAVFDYNTVANVGREVARYGAVHPDMELITQHITDTLQSRTWTTGIITESLLITPTLNPGRVLSATVQVEATYEHHWITGPIILAVGGNPTLILHTESTMFTEFPVDD